jgi:ABC-2 type transport system permease protein
MSSIRKETPQSQQISPSSQTFWTSFLQTLKDIFTDKGVLLMLIIAPVIYGFFYPWPYSSEVVNHVPVGIIDNDNSTLSRTISRYAAASPQLDTQRFINEQAAKEAIW